MTAPVLPGAEPFSATGDDRGVLVLHGFTGNPYSMRGVAERLAAAGLTVDLPLLPGHGTRVEDLVPTRWVDWVDAVEGSYRDLARRCRRVAVVGMSMGGSLACWVARRHADVAGLVLVNPLVEPDDGLRAAADELLRAGTEVAPGIGSDIARPGTPELSYPGTPLAAAISLLDAVEELAPGLPAIACPVLLLSSREDHVVAPSNGDRVVASVSGPVERVWLERSYHVATLDFDRSVVEERTVAFVTRALGEAPAAAGRQSGE